MTSRVSTIAALSSVLTGILLLSIVPTAHAHCDSLDGPVVLDAQTALANGDVSPVLKWVNAADEPAIRDAFNKTIEIRQLNKDVLEMADRWFFETLVRIHRASEGEPFTGLKPAGSVRDQVILMADQTIVDGSAEGFADKIAAHTREAVQQRFDHLMELSAARENSVEDGRAWVAAYVDYIHFAKAVADVVHGQHTHGNAEQHTGNH